MAGTRIDGFLERWLVLDATIVVGIDPSLTSTGIAVAAISEAEVHVETGRIATKLKGHDRLEELLSNLIRICRSADLVVVEGLAFAAHDRDRAGAGFSWMLRHELWRERVPVAQCPPATRALYATGKGNASKDTVLAAAIERYRHVTALDQNDVADAMVMMALGCRHLGCSLEPSMPARNLDALEKIDWPATAVAA